MPAHGDLSTHLHSEMHSLLHPSLTNKIFMAHLQVKHTVTYRGCSVLVCTHGLSSVYLRRLLLSTKVDTENIKLTQKDRWADATRKSRLQVSSMAQSTH